jgi:hypothetical protein
MDDEQNSTPAPAPEAETDDAGMERTLAAGNNGESRAGAFALLTVVLLLCGALYYHFSENGGNAFLLRLDSELLTHAEFSLASAKNGNDIVAVPSWPLRLYSALRRDIAFYAAIAAIAGVLWGLSVQARARRDVYLLNQKFSREIAVLRARLDMIDNSPVNVDTKIIRQPVESAKPENAETVETKG